MAICLLDVRFSLPLFLFVTAMVHKIKEDVTDFGTVVTSDLAQDSVATACACEYTLFRDWAGDDLTGSPTDVVATQENGLVRLSWVDQSLCEEVS